MRILDHWIVIPFCIHVPQRLDYNDEPLDIAMNKQSTLPERKNTANIQFVIGDFFYIS